MARTETVEFTNMCMICDGSRVVVICFLQDLFA